MHARTRATSVPVRCIQFRKHFHAANQQGNESVSEWFSRLKLLAMPCEFGKELNQFLLDRFLLGLKDNLLEIYCNRNSHANLDGALELLGKYENELNITFVSNTKLENSNHTDDETDDEKPSDVEHAIEDRYTIGYDEDICKLESPDQNGTKSEFTENEESVTFTSKPLKRKNGVAPLKKKPKIFECEICQYKCDYRCHLRRHKRIHLNEKSFVCHICGKGFNICNYLTIHMKRHTGEKPYNCEVCHKNFINSSKLKRHFRMHTGERPYSCNVCNKSFAQREYLNTHMRIHTGEKPYQCQICKKGFSQPSSLVSHQKIH